MTNPYRRLRNAILPSITGAPYTFTYAADGFAVRKKYLPFGRDTTFDAAWSHVDRVNASFYGGVTPDVRWRAHTCIWAASNCLSLEGSFVEFGVNTGMLSSMICRVLGAKVVDKNFYLFDTFHGIPMDSVSGKEAINAKKLNETLYADDVFDFTKSEFSAFPKVKLVKGALPATIDAIYSEKLSYVSIDLNSAKTEMAVISKIWDQIVIGGHIVLDDYGFPGHDEQNDAWNKFSASVGRQILALPTGQGLIVK